MLRLTLTQFFVSLLSAALLGLLGLLGMSTAQAQSTAFITAESLQAWALREATQQYGSLEGARIEVRVGALDARLTQAPCAQPQYSVPSGARLWGHSAVMVRCPGNAAWSLRAPVNVRVWGTALVAARALPALLPIPAEDLRPGEVELTREAQGVLTDLRQLQGRVPTRTIGAGQPLPLAALRAPQVIGQGDPVKVVGQGTGFAIATDAIAQSAALEGQSVRVRTESGRVLTGIARTGRVVEVNF